MSDPVEQFLSRLQLERAQWQRLMDALPQFDLVRPRSLDEVIAARATHADSRLLGGGTENMNGVTLDSDLTIPGSNLLNVGASGLNVRANTIHLVSGASTGNAGLAFQGSQTFASGTLSYEGTGMDSVTVVGAFTLGAAASINVAANGILGDANGSFTNQGSISVSGSTASLAINFVTYSNAGALQVSNSGNLTLLGNWSNQNTITSASNAEGFCSSRNRRA